MAGFVFIHGAWLGGWTFDAVGQRLSAMGHVVDAPDLPGMNGGGGGDAPTLADWSAFAVERCTALRQRSGQPVLLVGHSRGGVVLSRAAEEAPDAIAGLIYLCAMMLPGGSVGSAWDAHLLANPALAALVNSTPNGEGTCLDREHVAELFAQNATEADAEMLAARIVTEPNAPRRGTLRLTPERYGPVPRTYIACTQDRVIPIARQRDMIARQPGTKTIEIEADHSPFLSAPDALARALDAAAGVGS
ncbi:alpha/beta fold hydrolase [Sphingobium sp. CR28]|uniref:alpha/beta fold hydrolase n=1 Tax=Sphingobium sp. CR28 TaxID=3400272 RepID=UPI003FEE850D